MSSRSRDNSANKKIIIGKKTNLFAGSNQINYGQKITKNKVL